MNGQGNFTLVPTVRLGYRPGSEFTKGSSLPDNAGTVDVTLTVKGEGEAGTKMRDANVSLRTYGPGEVTNLDADQIVRMEPEPDTTAFPPNYFPLVEFDDPRLPWLFSPEKADDAGRTRPWLCLVAVPESASTIQPPGAGPLSVLETTGTELPDAGESWAWAHAQHVGPGDPESAFASRSRATKSRLLCPRNLSPKTTYRACVVPIFEPGRRAGLGLDPYPDNSSSMNFAWSGDGAVRLPIYHHWRFTSAAAGDFEALAEELEPTTFDTDIGFRTADVSNPGPEGLKPPSGADTDVGTVDVGGALMAVGAEPNGYDEELREKLRNLLNTPSDIVATTDFGAVGPPLYGQWHAGVAELEPTSVDTGRYYYPSWFNQLNTDPRNRIAAGYGTEVIQREQSALMAAAWEQFGEIQQANRALRRMQLAREVQQRRYADLGSLSTGSLLGMTAPIHRRLLDEDIGKTVQAQNLLSDLPTGLLSPTFRRITRPTGPLARRTGVSLYASKFATRVETGKVPQLSDGLSFTRDAIPTTATGADALSGDLAAGNAIVGDTGLQAGGGEWQTQSLDVSGQDRTGQGATGAASDEFRPGGSPIQGDASGPGDADPFAGPGPDGDGGNGSSEPSPPPGIERVHALLDSIDAQARTAEREVDTLATAIRRDDAATVTNIVDEEPTTVDRCATIGPDTFAPLSRRVSKLLADRDVATLPPNFDRGTASRHLQRLHGAQRDLDDAIADAVVRLRADPPQPRRARDALDRAKQALAKFQRTTSAIRSALEAAPRAMQTMSGSLAGEQGEFTIDTEAFADIGAAAPTQIQIPSKENLRSTVLAGIDPATAIHDHAADVLGVPELRYREDPVAEVMAAPTFDTFAYELLAELNEDYFLPGVGEVPKNSMGVLQTNPEFIEAFMAGLNHEMARELQWRRYPTDRKGTYFRRFWNRAGNPDVDPTDPEEMADIGPMHTWDQNDLGENSPRDDEAKIVLLIRGELLRRYPNTDIFAAKAVGDGDGAEEPDRVPALPGTHVTRQDAQNAPNLTFPVLRGTLEPDITFFGFDLTLDQALYDPYHTEDTDDPDDHPDEGWFFVLQEPPVETRFGMDAGAEEGPESPPLGITHGSGTTEQIDPANADPDAVEHGWNALSWAQLTPAGEKANSQTYVDVDGSRPGTESWSVDDGTSYIKGAVTVDDLYDRGDAATWGYNSAHMARATWQLPVRISIHADDMITEDSAESWRLTTMPDSFVTTIGSDDE